MIAAVNAMECFKFTIICYLVPIQTGSILRDNDLRGTLTVFCLIINDFDMLPGNVLISGFAN